MPRRIARRRGRLAPALTWAAALGVPLAVVHVFHPLDVATAEAPTAAIQPRALCSARRSLHVVRSYRPADAIHDVAEESARRWW